MHQEGSAEKREITNLLAYYISYYHLIKRYVNTRAHFFKDFNAIPMQLSCIRALPYWLVRLHHQQLLTICVIMRKALKDNWRYLTSQEGLHTMRNVPGTWRSLTICVLREIFRHLCHAASRSTVPLSLKTFGRWNCGHRWLRARPAGTDWSHFNPFINRCRWNGHFKVGWEIGNEFHNFVLQLW